MSGKVIKIIRDFCLVHHKNYRVYKERFKYLPKHAKMEVIKMMLKSMPSEKYEN